MTPNKGTVYLVGAGPGDPELITVRGLKLVKHADVVVYDRLVAAELLGEACPDAELVNVGKAPGNHVCTQDQINNIIINRAVRGLTVVRLKGGDPFIFGRGAEERHACAAAGIPCMVVPGVSSATAAPASAGIPVTHRRIARSFAVVTAHNENDTDPGHQPAAAASTLDYHALASIDTLVIMMGRAKLGEVVQRLVAAGRDPQTPAACIERATTSKQRVTVADLGTIADAADRDGLTSPVVTVIGDTVALADSGADKSQTSAHGQHRSQHGP